MKKEVPLCGGRLREKEVFSLKSRRFRLSKAGQGNLTKSQVIVSLRVHPDRQDGRPREVSELIWAPFLCQALSLFNSHMIAMRKLLWPYCVLGASDAQGNDMVWPVSHC